ncbi:hypothetical protein CTAYLR_007422 [Chrysophaeum taylorii]|uniref:Uncharacterized protein n=1 Tax=Chrysophaeum taylorii TaxID=2483200 RepID=A0AAD7U5J3_9STRA|nr:hypothetical protein CTAYLR_007422 [Chrysophaeum taylorii]
MIGLDAFVVLRFFRMWKRLFGLGVLFGTIVLMPTYQTGMKGETGFYEFTMRNLKKGSVRLWAPWSFVYFWTFLVLRSLERESRLFLEWRREYLSEGDQIQARCSVIVERVPPALRADEALLEYFGTLVGSENVFSAVVYLDLRDLENKLRRRDKIASSYRRALDGKGCCEADASALASRLDEADAQLALARDRALAEEAIILRTSTDLQQKNEGEEERPRGWLGRKIAEFEKNQLGVVESTAPPPPQASAAAGVSDLLRTAVDTSQNTLDATLGGLTTTLNLEDLVNRYYQKSSTGVVTLTNPGTAADVSQLALTSTPLGIEAKPAPPPSDVVWQNAGVAVGAAEWRSMVADAGLWFAAILWTPVVSVIQALSNLSEMAKLLPFLRPFVKRDQYEYARTLVTGYVPVVALLGLLAIVPICLELVAIQYIGHKSYAEVQRYVLSRHFYFQLLSIFVTVLAGSISSVLKSFFNHPQSLLKLLGKSLPNISAYFVQTVIVKTLFSLAWELARPLPYFFTSARRKYRRWVTKNQRTFRPLPPEFRIGHQVPSALMVVLVGTLYAPIAPLILPLSFCFFVVADAVFARQFLFVYVSTYEGGGLFLWPALVSFSILSLVVSQCTVISYLTILSGARQAPLLAPLPFVTVVVYRRLVRFYQSPAKVLDRETAVCHDLYDTSRYRHLLVADLYRHPALYVDSVTAARVRAEVARGDDDDDAHINGGPPPKDPPNPLVAAAAGEHSGAAADAPLLLEDPDESKGASS